MSCSVPFTPIIVAKLALTGQAANISATTVYTSTEDGDYEVAVYASQSLSLGLETIISLTWTDEYILNTQGVVSEPGLSGNFTATVRIPSGNSIQVSAQYLGAGGSETFDLFVTVTKK